MRQNTGPPLKSQLNWKSQISKCLPSSLREYSDLPVTGVWSKYLQRKDTCSPLPILPHLLLPVYQHYTSCSGSCQYSSPSSNRSPLLTHLPPLCAVLTFKGLVWPRAPWCHALGPEMPSLSLCLSVSCSLTLSFFGLARSAQSSQKSFAGAVENGLCLEFEHGYADLG